MMLDPWLNKRNEILTGFVHSESGDMVADKDNWRKEYFWQTAIPHEHLSGQCHTYNPAFESEPGWRNGIR